MEKIISRTVKTVALATILLVGCLALAQAAPRVELQAGYTFLNLDPSNGPKGVLHGWTGSTQFNVTRRLGFVAEAGGSYGKDLYVNETVHTYTFGPRVSIYRGERVNFFGHTLLGVGYLRASRGGSFDTARGFSTAIGAGVDVGLTKHLGARLIQTDYLMSRFADSNQHNFRFSTGLVLRFGGESKAK